VNAVVVESDTDAVLVQNETTILVAHAEGKQGPAGPPGSSVSSIVWNEAPSGTINGANDTFTLSGAPSGLLLSLNGLIQNEGITGDFVLSGATITFNTGSEPQIGDVLLATYIV
jgi:hypothetical protein